MPSAVRSRALASFLVSSTIVMTIGVASAARLPDGIYRCQLYSGSMLMHLGDIEIAGSSYRGPAYDGNYEATYEYELTDSGTINWSGPMGGFDSGGNRIVSSVLVGDADRPAFDVTIQLPSGNFSTVSCTPE